MRFFFVLALIALVAFVEGNRLLEGCETVCLTQSVSNCIDCFCEGADDGCNDCVDENNDSGESMCYAVENGVDGDDCGECLNGPEKRRQLTATEHGARRQLRGGDCELTYCIQGCNEEPQCIASCEEECEHN